MRLTAEERFWAKVDRRGQDDCWEWTAHRNAFGYGQFAPHGRVWPAHRFSYELNVGPIPAGLLVLHHCDNPPCVNPAHLFVGTQLDNVHDMIAKGRQAILRGESTGGARLTREDVVAIRARYAAGSATRQKLADEFGIAVTTVGSVIRGQHWTTVGGPTRCRATQRGEDSACAKLTAAQVAEIRARYPAEQGKALAAEYGVATTTVSAILTGRTWRNGFDGRPARARAGACRRGHPFTPENTILVRNGWRRCRTCLRQCRTAATGKGGATASEAGASQPVVLTEPTSGPDLSALPLSPAMAVA